MRKEGATKWRRKERPSGGGRSDQVEEEGATKGRRKEVSCLNQEGAMENVMDLKLSWHSCMRLS
jgi:hypothetical protein